MLMVCVDFFVRRLHLNQLRLTPADSQPTTSFGGGGWGGADNITPFLHPQAVHQVTSSMCSRSCT